MLDFIKVKHKKITDKNGNTTAIDIYPEFVVGRRITDVMIRGSFFYAIWDEAAGLWSTDEYDVQRLVDDQLYAEVEKLKSKYGEDVNYIPQTLTNFSTGKWMQWRKFTKNVPDNHHELDSNITFQNDEITKESYVSKRVPYEIHAGATPAYDTLMSTLYSDEERAKLEWAIGSIFVGDSKRIQKFIVLYGSAGTGKGTVLSIIDQLFDGYCSSFEAKELTSNNSFALEPFKENPLVAIQYDGDLSRISDNTRLNTVVSHEPIVINEKYKGQYEIRCRSFLFMGTNSPVMITDAKSGILRRLIDVRPTGNIITPERKYRKLMHDVKFELGAIAQHCIDVYKEMGIEYYSKYKPIEMMGATNDMYNFVEENYETFARQNGTSLKNAYAMYKAFCDEANVPRPLKRTAFGEELKSYFNEFLPQARANGMHIRSYYSGFDTSKFEFITTQPIEMLEDVVFRPPAWLLLEEQKSLFDEQFSDCIAQYSKKDGTPTDYWDNVTTTLAELDTSIEHYVRVPKTLICVDFDIRGEDGEKDRLKNLEAASKFPETYAEYSKSGKGLHLYYIYAGDVTQLSRIYDDNVEVKVFTGNAALRRRLCGCNCSAITTISGGLPLKAKKGGKAVFDKDGITNEKQLRKLIKNCLLKKHHGATKPEVDYIYSELEKAYNSGFYYDVTDLRPAISAFALNSTNRAVECMSKVGLMKFKSEEDLPAIAYEDENGGLVGDYAMFNDKDTDMIIFDIEVFPNLNLICWKFIGEGKPVYSLKNPTPQEIEPLFKSKLIGFNNRSYDNHILYAIYIGKTPAEVFDISQKIIAGSKNAKFGSAYNISYTDIYDFISKKQGLKKWEIELGIHHQELGFKWDEPVPESKWDLVAAYCKNDVIATEAVWNARQADFAAREILASLSGLTVNDPTRLHTTRIIFGDDKNPKLEYTDLSEMFPGYEFNLKGFEEDKYTEGKAVTRKSWYRGEDPGEGGYVYAEPGQYRDVALLDIASMHPTSAIQLNIFGDYTKRFEDIVQARLAIKHRDMEKLKGLLNGALEPYVGDDASMDALSAALKIVINSVYGYTKATFDNPFKDPRNVDNIVAKRGALFMINLRHEVQDRGFKVAHIKTDSIKIPEATPEIIDFVMEYGKKYGYTFEHEATYDRMCLVNDAVYVAKYDKVGKRDKPGKCAGEWTATGKQFQVHYVFKNLFSHEEIIFSDLCETRSVTSAMYLDMNENLPEDEHNYVFVGRSGQFCPVKSGCGGGVLVREKDGNYSAVNGTKGFRWLESEVVKNLGKEDDIDKSYYQKLADEAVETISKFGDFDSFVNGDILDYTNAVPFMNVPESFDILDEYDAQMLKEAEYGKE